jgi:uncharacterized membrane protein YdjX (TVP38/TMEM64 family)
MQKRYVSLGIFCLLLLTGILLIRSGVSIDEIQGFIESKGAYAPLMYIGAYAVLTVCFVPGSPLTLLGGALFGSFLGTLYTIVGASLGALSAFLISRIVRGKLPRASTTSAIRVQLERYDARIKENGFLTVLFLRFVPLFPFNGLNYALGLTSVRFRAYAWGTVLGIIPGTFAYTYFGDALATLNPVAIAGAICVLVIVIILGRLIRTWFSEHE